MAILSNSTDPFGDGSLIAKYLFDGDATDLTGNYHGTATNVTYDNGRFGQAVVLNGESSIVESQIPELSELSISLFFTATSSDAFNGQYLVSLGYNNTQSFIVFVEDQLIRMVLNGSAYDLGSFTLGNEHHLVLSLKAGDVAAYIDGELSSEINTTWNGTYPSAFELGYAKLRDSTTSWFEGSISLTEVYNRALTSNEVLEILNQSSPYKTLSESILETDGLLGYYPLYENGEDASANGNHMQQLGVVNFADEAITPNGKGHFISESSLNGYDNCLFIDTPINMRSMEVWAMLSDDLEWRAIFSTNSMLEREDNSTREMITTDGTGNLYSFNSEVTPYEAGFFLKPVHVISQYESDIDKTVTYLNGVVFSSTDGNAFSDLKSGSKTMVGQYSYVNAALAKTIQGGSKTSDFALYNRSLTQEEIDWRVYQNEPKTKSIVTSTDPFGDGSLVAKYLFDGDATDLTGGYDGVATNVTYEEGKFGQCGVFDGVDSNVTLDFVAENNMENTFSFWINSTLEQGYFVSQPFSMGCLVFSYSHVASEFTGSIAVSNSDSEWFSSGGLQLDKGTLYNIVVVVNQTTVDLYVNGARSGTQIVWDGTYNPLYLDSQLTIGSSSEVTVPFKGCIDQVEIYSRALTQEEIGYLYKQEMPATSESWLDAIEVPTDLVIYPADALLTTTEGTGLKNESGAPIYFQTYRNINKGEAKVVTNIELSEKAYVNFSDDGTLTITEGESVVTGSTTLDSLSIAEQNGQIALTGENEEDNAIYSFYHNYFSLITTVELLDGETIDEINDVYYYYPIVPFHFNLSAFFINQEWANKETKIEANPQPEQVFSSGFGSQTVETVAKNNPFYNDPVLDQKGEQRQYGYIESQTEVSGVSVSGKRVLLFANNTGLIIDETVSDKNGNYRFDSLLLGKKYMVTAQYGTDDENTPPDYSATTVDWQSPTPYSEV